ncbi:MAG: carboxymuconolactone decarboxylase family protein [Thaumarchaeota archaeon]|nr:carboxymuconolactone decarboxylase family protein [Nitrososphaerota archaeon]
MVSSNLPKDIVDYCVQQYGSVPEEYELLGKYNPDALRGFITERESTTREPPEGALDMKTKELIITAIEIAVGKPAILHARRAVELGATVQEVAEVVSINLWHRGMSSYVLSGKYALKAAEEQATSGKKVVYSEHLEKV